MTREIVRRSTPLLIRQWKYLWREESVELRQGPDVIGTGQVEDMTADGTTLWIQLMGGLGRMMIHRADGTEIWRIEARIMQDRCTYGERGSVDTAKDNGVKPLVLQTDAAHAL